MPKTPRLTGVILVNSNSSKSRVTHPLYYYTMRKIIKFFANFVLETFLYSAIFRSYWNITPRYPFTYCLR